MEVRTDGVDGFSDFGKMVLRLAEKDGENFVSNDLGDDSGVFSDDVIGHVAEDIDGTFDLNFGEDDVFNEGPVVNIKVELEESLLAFREWYDASVKFISDVLGDDEAIEIFDEFGVFFNDDKTKEMLDQFIDVVEKNNFFNSKNLFDNLGVFFNDYVAAFGRLFGKLQSIRGDSVRSVIVDYVKSVGMHFDVMFKFIDESYVDDSKKKELKLYVSRALNGGDSLVVGDIVSDFNGQISQVASSTVDADVVTNPSGDNYAILVQRTSFAETPQLPNVASIDLKKTPYVPGVGMISRDLDAFPDEVLAVEGFLTTVFDEMSLSDFKKLVTAFLSGGYISPYLFNSDYFDSDFYKLINSVIEEQGNKKSGDVIITSHMSDGDIHWSFLFIGNEANTVFESYDIETHKLIVSRGIDAKYTNDGVLMSFYSFVNFVFEISLNSYEEVVGEFEEGVGSEVEKEVVGEFEEGVGGEVEKEVVGEFEEGVGSEVEKEVVGEVEEGVGGEVEKEVVGEFEEGVGSEVEKEVVGEVKKGVDALKFFRFSSSFSPVFNSILLPNGRRRKSRRKFMDVSSVVVGALVIGIGSVSVFYLGNNGKKISASFSKSVGADSVDSFYVGGESFVKSVPSRSLPSVENKKIVVNKFDCSDSSFDYYVSHLQSIELRKNIESVAGDFVINGHCKKGDCFKFKKDIFNMFLARMRESNMNDGGVVSEFVDKFIKLHERNFKKYKGDGVWDVNIEETQRLFDAVTTWIDGIDSNKRVFDKWNNREYKK